MPRSRRLLATLVALALVAGACADDLTGDTTAPPSSTTTAPPGPKLVEGVAPPRLDRELLEPAPEALDLAAQFHVQQVGSDEASIEQFLYAALPVQIFDALLTSRADRGTGTSVLTGLDVEQLLWLLHLSGHHRGQWLRASLEAQDADAPIRLLDDAAIERRRRTTVAQTERALRARRRKPGFLLAYATLALDDIPLPCCPDERPARGVITRFGEALGALSDLQSNPPRGVSGPAPAASVSCIGFIACDFPEPTVRSRPRLLAAQALAINDPTWNELAAQLKPRRQIATLRGRDTRQNLLSVRGLDGATYRRILGVEATALEVVHTVTLATMLGVVSEDPARTRVAARAFAGLIVWLDAYDAGLAREVQEPLPTFSEDLVASS